MVMLCGSLIQAKNYAKPTAMHNFVTIFAVNCNWHNKFKPRGIKGVDGNARKVGPLDNNYDLSSFDGYKECVPFGLSTEFWQSGVCLLNGAICPSYGTVSV